MSGGNDAMQIMGGIGYINVYPIECMLRDARLPMIWTGTNEIMNLVIQHEYYRELLATPFQGAMWKPTQSMPKRKGKRFLNSPGDEKHNGHEGGNQLRVHFLSVLIHVHNGSDPPQADEGHQRYDCNSPDRSHCDQLLFECFHIEYPESNHEEGQVAEQED